MQSLLMSYLLILWSSPERGDREGEKEEGGREIGGGREGEDARKDSNPVARKWKY